MPNLPLRTIALAAAVSLGAMTLSQPAQAGRKTAAIIAGIAVGAIVASALAENHRHRHHHYDHGYRKRRYKSYYYAPPPPPPPPVYYYKPVRPHYAPPPAVYQYAPQPWTPEWYAYCSQRYRSFDPRSGTFQPYRGPRRLCQ